MNPFVRIIMFGLSAIFALAMEFENSAGIGNQRGSITRLWAASSGPNAGRILRSPANIQAAYKKPNPLKESTKVGDGNAGSIQPVADPTLPTDAQFQARCSASAKVRKFVGKIDLSLREKIGQMLIFGFQGYSTAQKYPQTVRDQLRRGEIGGVIFLKHNVESASDVKSLVKLFKQANSKLPPLIVLDQEGGAVQRLGPKVTFRRFPSAAKVAAKNNWRNAYDLYNRQAKALKKWGFNVNLGPVLDVNVNPHNPVIGRFGRSFSSKARVVEDYGRAFVLAHREAGLGTALKHFPGHGSSKTDSHKGFVDISETWQKDRELAPFRSLIKQGCADMVLIGHVYLKNYQDRDEGNDPATFSKKIVTGILRNQLGFKGVIITDDLEMGAIRKKYSFEDSLKKAIRAGNNILVIGNSINPRATLTKRAIDIIFSEAERDPKFRRLVEESFQKIIAYKGKFASD